MSRRLVMTVGEMIPKSGSSFRTDRQPHLIVVNQETGKALALELHAQNQYAWMPLPDVPLHLLDAEKPATVPLDQDRCCVRRSPAFNNAKPAQCVLRNGHDGPHGWPSEKMMEIEAEREATALDDTRCNHFSLPSSNIGRRRCYLPRGHTEPHEFARGMGAVTEAARTLESDIAEDRH